MEMTQAYLDAYQENDYKTMFYEAYGLIQRDGADKLLTWLRNTDFWTAPASTRYHLNCEGGLLEHSVHVWQRLRKLYMDEYGDQLDAAIEEKLAVVGLLHDLCKVDVYKTEFRNKKNEKGQWERVPYYTFDDDLPYGHGEKSVYIISGFMRLSREEAFAIRYHMGAWMDGEKNNVSKTFNMFPLALLAHVADSYATFLDERNTAK